MANYLVTRHKTVLGTAAEVAELMETYIETIDDAKAIIQYDIIPTGRDVDRCYGIIVHRT